MSVLLYLLWILLATIIIIGAWITMDMLLNKANGQETKAPPAVVPTPVNTPTPTQPNPNLQYLPQKAYVQAYAPENGLPVGQQPLQIVPQVVPQQVQNNALGGFDIGSIMPYVASIGAGLLAKMGFDKAKKTEDITQQQSAQIVQSKEVEHAIAKQVYENMPDKGESIKDAPEIKLETLVDNKEEAIKTASKA